MSSLFIKSCEVKSGSTLIDPCSCAHYYKKVDLFDNDRRQCRTGQLWDHIRKQCLDQRSVLNGGICNPEQPWNRCLNNQESELKIIKARCIKDGLFSGENTSGLVGEPGFGGKALPANIQAANAGLVIAAMIAAVVITGTLLKMIFSLRGNCLYGFRSKEKIKLKRVKTTGKRVEIHERVVSERYEDIDEEKDLRQPSSHPAWQNKSGTTTSNTAFNEDFRIKVSGPKQAFPQKDNIPKPPVFLDKRTHSSSLEMSSSSKPIFPTVPSRVQHPETAAGRALPMKPMSRKSQGVESRSVDIKIVEHREYRGNSKPKPPLRPPPH